MTDLIALLVQLDGPLSGLSRAAAAIVDEQQEQDAGGTEDERRKRQHGAPLVGPTRVRLLGAPVVVGGDEHGCVGTDLARSAPVCGRRGEESGADGGVNGPARTQARRRRRRATSSARPPSVAGETTRQRERGGGREEEGERGGGMLG